MTLMERFHCIAAVDSYKLHELWWTDELETVHKYIRWVLNQVDNASGHAYCMTKMHSAHPHTL